MANVYVWSGAGGAGTGADWTNAYTTLQAAFSAKAAGDDFWVAHDHAQTQASALTMTCPGTAANPCRVICASRSGSTPPVSADLATTATITTTGSSNTITVLGTAYYYGVSISQTSAIVTTNIDLTDSVANSLKTFDNCKFIFGGSTSSAITLGNSIGQRIRWVNTSVQFGAVGQTLKPEGAAFVWEATAAPLAGATFPTALFNDTTAQGCYPVTVRGVDLSSLGSGKSLVGSSINRAITFIFQNCKLGGSVAVSSSSQAQVLLIRCDSADTNYRHEKYSFEGTQTVETTIVHTGGASDGVTPISWSIITTANSKRTFPFEVMPITIWNETTGSAITLTIEGIWGGGAVPTNADIWMDVEYLGTSGFPLASIATSGTADVLATGTNLTSSSETWGGSTTKFKLQKTITPQEKGPLTIYIKAALASSTFYIDPEVTVS